MGAAGADGGSLREPDPNWARLRELLTARATPGMLVFDQDGNLVGLTPADETSEPSRSTLGDLLASGDMVVVTDAERRITAANQAAATLLQTGIDELLGRDLLERVDPARRDSLAARFALGTTREGAQSQMVTMAVTRADGTTLWLEGQATNRLADPEVQGVVVRAREVRAPAPAPAVAAALADDVVDLLPMGLVAVAEDLTIVRVNRSFATLAGRDESDLVGERLTDFIPVDDLARYVTHHGRAIHEGDDYRDEIRLVLPDGRHVWTLMSGSPTVLGARTVVINQVVDITDTKILVDELAHMATTDDLTGLPNRAMLDDRALQALARQRRHGGIVAAIFIDLDWFKPVNDLHKWEHRAGDEALVVLGGRIRDAVRPTDTAARYGGDEFLVLCTDFSSVDDVDTVVRRIFDALHQPVDLGGLRVVVGASIGVVVVPPGSQAAWPQVKAAADAAMFRAKEEGKGRVVTVALPADS